ncbi:MAG: putative rane protein [Acidobacteriaceae bacterium]|nr:putative rane protein [Acidobacteriaceae bacterium]
MRGHNGFRRFSLSPLRKLKVLFLRFWKQLQLRHGKPQYLLDRRRNSGGATGSTRLCSSALSLERLQDEGRNSSHTPDRLCSRAILRLIPHLCGSLCTRGVVRTVPIFAGINCLNHWAFRIAGCKVQAFHMNLISTLMSSRRGLMLTIGTILALATGYYHVHLLTPRVQRAQAERGLGNGYYMGGDFYPIWLTSRELLTHRRNPYSVEVTKEIQAGLYGRSLDAHNVDDPPEDYRTFAYPLYVDFLFFPLAYLPFTTVRLMLVILLPMISIAAIFIWLRAMYFNFSWFPFAFISILTLSSYPLLEALIAEQAGIVVWTLAGAAVLAVREERYKKAGAFLALATIKPQMVVLLIVWLAAWTIADWHKRKPLLWTFLSLQVLLWGAGELALPGWPSEWLGVLTGYPRYGGRILPIRLLKTEMGLALCVLFLAVLGYGFWQLRQVPSSSRGFSLGIAGVLAGTVLIALPGDALYDHLLLLPVLLLTWDLRKWFWRHGSLSRALLGLSAGLVTWQWIVASALSVIAVVLHQSREISNTALELPEWPILLLPFILFALLTLAFLNMGKEKFWFEQQATLE